MHVRLLGTAAGGGFPQWNCGCRNCAGVRSHTIAATTRTQSCIAVSADGARWFLINASPDIRAQLESFPPLHPHAVRGSGVAGVLLTSGDLDHTLGLFILREGRPMLVYASNAIRDTVTNDLGAGSILGHYCGINWREAAEEIAPLCDADGRETGLEFSAFPIAGKPPRYARRKKAEPGDAIGYRIVDSVTGSRIVCVPGIAQLDEKVMTELQSADLAFFDGTFWSNNEMSTAGVGDTTASQMGHLPVGGPEGSLARLAGRISGRLVFVHLNNTNPMLDDDSSERKTVEAAGAIVGEDGMEFRL